MSSRGRKTIAKEKFGSYWSSTQETALDQQRKEIMISQMFPLSPVNPGFPAPLTHSVFFSCYKALRVIRTLKTISFVSL